MTANGTNEPIVVVIDDTPANLRLLAAILSEAAYRVRPLPGGRLGLQSVMSEPPDLVLLDVDMPDMSGFEVCRRIKAVPSLASVPVIFISALDDPSSKIEGFRAGAVDYVTKPFYADEIKARVHTHIELARTRRKLEASFDRLRELERLRETLTHMIVHDLRTPLHGLSLTLELIDTDPSLPDGVRPDVERARRCCVTLSHLVTSVLDVAKLEALSMPTALGDHPPAALVSEAIRQLGALATDPRLVVLELPEQCLRCDLQLSSRIIGNLVMNALSFAPARGGRVEVGAEPVGEAVRMHVRDNGPGIPAGAQAQIFDKFAKTNPNAARGRSSTGLGLAFCKMAVEAQGGRIGVRSDVGQGSMFWFELPQASEDSSSS